MLGAVVQPSVRALLGMPSPRAPVTTLRENPWYVAEAKAN